MNDFHLNKTHKFFYFQTRINRPNPATQTISPSLFWEKTLQVIDELHKGKDAHVYGLVYNEEGLKVIFSTPYFNENILMIEWELKLKNEFAIVFERPILCEPILDGRQLKQLLMEIYRSQLEIHHGRIKWLSPYNSLKLIIEGHRYAGLFKDPFHVVFQPQIVFQIGQLAISEAK